MTDSIAENSKVVRYKQSYWKTTGAAAFSTMLCVGLATIAPFPVISVAAGLLAGVAGVTTLAGLVVLYRDYRDDRGKPDLYWLWVNASRSGGVGSSKRVRNLPRFLFGNRPRPGDLVRVRDANEILATLDEHARTSKLPFMPEMIACCGRTFRVHRRIDKINDMIQRSGSRRVDDAVTLEAVRCDGSHHGGCQADCQIIWHDSWLRGVSSEASRESSPAGEEPITKLRAIVEKAAVRGIRETDGAATYMCQITELFEASHPMPRWDVRQDLRPLINGTVCLRAWLVAILTRLFNFVQDRRSGVEYPMLGPQLDTPSTPTEKLYLQPGEEVVIKKKDEIRRTTYKNLNRGLWFGREPAKFCQQRARVQARVETIIDERNGDMLTMKTPCILLDNAMATGEYLRFCPQNEHVFWREIWLRRTQEGPPQ